DLLDRGDACGQVFRPDVVAAGGRRVLVERPDLHAADALGEQIARELARPLDGGLEIFVTPQLIRRQAAIPGRGPVRGLESALVAAAVPGAGAGVVDPDGVPGPAAEQVGDRQPGRLPGDVPEGDVGGGVTAGLGPGA